jgi:YHS domain-containing protein
MSDLTNLIKRIDGEFAANDQRIKQYQAEQVKSYEERQQRLAQFEKTCDRLRSIWKPRLEALALKFGDKVKVTPNICGELREATFDFESMLASIKLRFSASTDQDVRKLVLDYRLDILPIFMKFEPHKQDEFPLDAIDETAVAKWIDDRIIDFVQTYLSLQHNEYYLKDHMVADPITGIRFPKFAAAATLDWNGQKYYFIGEKSRQEFARKNGIA